MTGNFLDFVNPPHARTIRVHCTCGEPNEIECPAVDLSLDAPRCRYVPGTASWVYEQLHMLDYTVDSAQLGVACGDCNTTASDLWLVTVPGR